MFAGILSLAGLWVKYRTLPKEKVAIQKTIGAGIGHFMQNLANQAAEEEGGDSSPGSALSIGGFKIDSATIQSIAQILQLVQQMGFLKGGGGGGSNPFLKP